jgi:hypothetical protein
MNQLKKIFIVILMGVCAVLAAQSDSQSYHGKRMSNGSAFEIVFISTENGIIQLGFSIPVNPQSVRPENIFLNGNPLNNNTAIKFNKTGKIVEIGTALPAGVVSVLVIREVRSFDDQELETEELDELVPDETIEYSIR